MKYNRIPVWIIIPILLLTAINSFAQTKLVKGTVLDSESEDPLIGCTILLKGTTSGTITDIDGNFEFEADLSASTILVFSYVGFDNLEIDINEINDAIVIKLEPVSNSLGDEVVISASRRSEKITESPISIQKINAKQISTAASGSFYQSMGNLQDVDITTSSMGFQIINTRGFNTTAPVRMVQFVDGMDNQAPGLNFPVGNLVGALDIDLESVELISGASSALYGANAFQGVVSMSSKNPFDYPGLQFKLKGGSRQLFDGQFRYATTLDKQKKLGIKVTAGYFRAEDWVADDDSSNVYGDLDVDINVSAIVRELQFDEDPEKAADFRALNTWLDFYPIASPGIVNVKTPGYRESQLSDNKTESIKAGIETIYKMKEDMNLSYLYKFGRGTAIYQGSNRYSINKILFQQHQLKFEGKGLTLKAYTTQENAGDSYDMVFSGINLSKIGLENYVEHYIESYFDVLSDLTNEFDGEPRLWQVDSAVAYATMIASDSAYLQPGTEAFDTSFNKIIKDPNLETGARFQDKSWLLHFDAQYNFDFIKQVDLMTGFSFRRYMPQSFGTIFSDTLLNPADTLQNGNPDQGAEFVNLATWVMGGFVQASKDFFDEKLKLIASLRVDKHENYETQFSPRGSIVTKFKKNTFRVSAQTAFRSPTLQNQYILLDLGVIKLKGNLNGVTNGYTKTSADEFFDLVDDPEVTINQAQEVLDAVILDPIRPEQVTSVEAGYRGVITKNLYIDLTAYYNIYKDFIGDIRLLQPLSGAQAGEESGINSLLTEDYDLVQYPTNAKEKVTSYGFSTGLNYYIVKSLMASANYTYSDINTKNLNDPIIPGFNTPKHKLNIGLSASNIFHGLGFNVNYKWVQGFQWQSPFGDGDVNSYNLLDLQVNYEFPKFITLQVGGSNILNDRHIEAYGSPTIGATVYTSILFDLERK
ncbi:MAG: TonB-dependent receptor [Chitinophagales bacterium]